MKYRNVAMISKIFIWHAYLHAIFQKRFRTAIQAIVLVAIIPWHSDAVAQLQAIGTRALGMGSSYVALANTAEAVFINPGGLSQIEGFELNLFYQKPFGLPDVDFATLALSLPVSSFRTTFGAVSLGNSIFSEQKLAAAFSHHYRQRLYYGVLLSYWRTHIKDYGTSGAMAVDAGIIYPISNHLVFGAAAQNLNRAQRGAEALPQTLSAGIRFESAYNLSLSLEIFKDVRFAEEMRFGTEYRPFEKIALRAGTATHPNRFSAGFGVSIRYFAMDYAFFTHNDLGTTHQFSLTARLGSNPSANASGRQNRSVPSQVEKVEHGITALININTATADELSELPGIGPKTAKRIVAYRERNGPFRNKEDIQNVKGIGPATYERFESLITIEND